MIFIFQKISTSLLIDLLSLYTEGFLHWKLAGKLLVVTGGLLLGHELLYHPVEEQLGLASHTVLHRRLHPDRIVPGPLLLVLLGSLNLGQHLRCLDLFTLLLRIGDHCLGVGVFEYEGCFWGFGVFLSSCRLPKNVKLKDDVSIIWPDNGRKLSFGSWVDLDWVGKDTVFNVLLPELNMSELHFGICLRLSHSSKDNRSLLVVKVWHSLILLDRL